MWRPYHTTYTYATHSTSTYTYTYVSMPLRSNNVHVHALTSLQVGVQSSIKFMFEFTSTAGVLPSFDALTRINESQKLSDLAVYQWIAFLFTLFFCSLEVVEISSSGLGEYFTDMWNVMDWFNSIIFFLVWFQILTFLNQVSK